MSNGVHVAQEATVTAECTRRQADLDGCACQMVGGDGNNEGVSVTGELVKGQSISNNIFIAWRADSLCSNVSCVAQGCRAAGLQGCMYGAGLQGCVVQALPTLRS